MTNKCNSQIPNQMSKTDNTKQDSYISILKSQLIAGVSGEKNETDYTTYQFIVKDIEATETIILEELKNNGYKIPSSEKFNNKIDEIFKRIIDPKSESKYLQINFEDKCSKNFSLFKNLNSIDVNPYSTYVFKKGLFISDFYSIPEILDYTKISDLTKIENEAEVNNRSAEIKIFYWKDISDLKQSRKKNIQTIIARNMYLFNDSKAYITWLVQNDQTFIKNIIKVFGYDKEPKFNESVINNLNTKSVNNLEELYNYIVSKTCNGKLEIRDLFLKSYSDIYNNSKNVQDVLILKYLSSEIISNILKNNYNDAEKNKILAHIANIYDPLFKKYHHDGQNWGEMTILADYRDYLDREEWEKVKQEYQKNNYYNLPNLKAMIEYADMFDSVGAPN
ncbi:hypothetical protein AR686_13495 [Chryseobacterium aquaticum subsp. greenlandense]|uniref:Uncharacterized protein n=2 Tax=Chryseobacterium aquaticum TaxID=452084 RepID=A0A101CFT0_9FLAO|nr:hypothetical protein AR686_13495 [Chryseobacterium aquaticum subsp. greenlandense]